MVSAPVVHPAGWISGETAFFWLPVGLAVLWCLGLLVAALLTAVRRG